MISLFLFAHQDDEFGVFQQILIENKKGNRIICAYLTDGGRYSFRRNNESKAVLKKLGVQTEDIFFMGSLLAIQDGKLLNNADKVENWLITLIRELPQIKSIYVPAWEGGHPDHDMLHAIVVSIANRRELMNVVKQFPLYNGYACSGQLFRVFYPLQQNGNIQKTRIPWKNRIRFLKYCLSYPSQLKTWAGLFPFVLVYYLLSGEQILQPVSIERILQRPHMQKLYYERRMFGTWEETKNMIIAFLKNRS